MNINRRKSSRFFFSARNYGSACPTKQPGGSSICVHTCGVSCFFLLHYICWIWLFFWAGGVAADPATATPLSCFFNRDLSYRASGGGGVGGGASGGTRKPWGEKNPVVLSSAHPCVRPRSIRGAAPPSAFRSAIDLVRQIAALQCVRSLPPCIRLYIVVAAFPNRKPSHLASASASHTLASASSVLHLHRHPFRLYPDRIASNALPLSL
jgi:hypothetical protein